MRDFRTFFTGRMRVSFLVVWLYLWLVCTMQTITYNARLEISFFLLLGVLSFSASYFILKNLSEKFSWLLAKDDRRHSRLLGVVVALITFLVFELYLAGQYPGGMSTDSIIQFEQSLNGRYNDWHPALHTLLFFTLPIKAGGSLGLIVFMQMLYFSLAFGYLIYVLNKFSCPKVALTLLCGFVWLNPYLATYMVYPWKDIALTVFAMLLMGYYIQIVCTGGAWLKNKLHIVLFSAVTVVCSIMRHNAILFTLPLSLIALLYAVKNAKTRIAVAAGIVLCFSLVKISYTQLGVTKPGQRTAETVGLPLTVWCNVMQKDPQALPEATRDLMYEFASPEAYAYEYEPGSFNSIKWSGKFDAARVNQLSYQDVLKYTAQCFIHAPGTSIEALAKLTDVVWAIDGKDEPLYPVILENTWGISPRPFLRAEKLTDHVRSFFSSGLGRVFFGSIGFELLMMLLAAAVLYAKKRCSFIHILPLFCYDFGTMLLLSGRDYRFFLLNLPLWIPVLFLMVRDEKMFRAGIPSIHQKRGIVK